MKETIALGWLWITALGITSLGAFLSYLLVTGQTGYSLPEAKREIWKTGGVGLFGLALIALLIAGCTTIPEHCRDWQNPKQCARDHPEGEFFCDDTPERDPERCGLNEG